MFLASSNIMLMLLSIAEILGTFGLGRYLVDCLIKYITFENFMGWIVFSRMNFKDI